MRSPRSTASRSTTGPGSFTGLRVGLSAARGIALAADKPVVGVTTLTAYAAPVVSENGEHPVISAIDARHDQVYFQVVSGDGSSLIRPRVAPIEEALDAARFGAPHLVGNAAEILADRWPADAPPPFKVDPQPAPDIAWVAWLGAAVSPESCAGPAVLSARARRQAAKGSAAERRAAAARHDGLALRIGGAAARPWSNRRACATRRGWRNCMAHRFTAAGAKANSRPC